MGLFARIDGALPAVAFVDDHQIGTSTNGNHSHSLSFGAASSTRALIACVGYDSVANATGVTIGGVSATRLATVNRSGQYAQIWIAAVPTGTSGSVVIPNPDPGRDWTSSVGLYAATHLRSLTPVDTDTGSDTSPSTSVTVASRGIVISTLYFFATAAVGSSWSGVSEDMDVLYHVGLGVGSVHSAGHYIATTATTRSVSVTTSPTTAFAALATASFR